MNVSALPEPRCHDCGSIEGVRFVESIDHYFCYFCVDCEEGDSEQN